jgi:hypothetical protein
MARCGKRAWPTQEGMLMSNKTVVLAIFKDEESADAAAAALKDSGVAKGDAMGVLVLDEKGELKADKVGKRSWGKGAGIGAVVALCTPVGLAAGLIGGGLLGSLHHKNLGLDEADRERIGRELAGGKAAVGVLAPVAEVGFVTDIRSIASDDRNSRVSSTAVSGSPPSMTTVIAPIPRPTPSIRGRPGRWDRAIPPAAPMNMPGKVGPPRKQLSDTP